VFSELLRQQDMDLSRIRRRLRIPTPRWPSRDHRDFRSFGCLGDWRGRGSQSATLPPAPEDRPGGSRLPALTRIVGVRREDAALHVELRAQRKALEGRPLVRAREIAGSSRGAAPDRPAPSESEKRTWTIVLALN
jgi:hypothetical protein